LLVTTRSIKRRGPHKGKGEKGVHEKSTEVSAEVKKN